MIQAEQVEDYFISHAGIGHNPGISAEAREQIRRQFANNPSQLAAREHGLFVRPEGLILKCFDPTNPQHLYSIPLEVAVALLRRCRIFAGLDPGKLRWAFTLWGITPEFKVILFDEIFDQYGTIDSRSRLIQEMRELYGITRRFPIYADCANPTDIGEINEAFKRNGCDLRAAAVGMDKKLIKPGISRVESLIVRGNMAVRKESGSLMEWRLNWNSESEGIPQIGSRFLYEIGQWRWPKRDKAMDKAQKEVPDDNAADGADMMASMRYALMSALKPGKEEEGPEREAFSPESIKEDGDRSRTLKHRMEKRKKSKFDVDTSWGDY